MNLEDLDPDSPEYQAALDAAQAEEDAATGNLEGGSPNAEHEGDDDPEGEARPGSAAAEPAQAAAAAADTAADTGAPASPEKPANPAGVLSKDGKTVLPFAVVQSARTERKLERDARLAAEAENERLRQEIADLREGKKPAPSEADAMDQALAEAIEEMPALAHVAKELKAQREEIAALKGKPAPTQETPTDTPDDDPMQSAIDSVPMLATWQATDPEKWKRAVQLDVALDGSPKWAGKPMAERFAHVAKLVADQFDIQVEDPAPQERPKPAPNRADPKDVISKAARAAPNTLSDMKGGSAADTETRTDRMPPQKMLARVQDMSDDEIDGWLAKFG